MSGVTRDFDRAVVLGGAGLVGSHPAVVDDPQRRCPDISRAVQRLDWRPHVQLEEGLKQTIAWFAEREPNHL